MSFGHSIQVLVEGSDNDLHRAAPWWRRVSVGQVCEILNGYPFDSNFFTKAEGVPLIRIRDVTSGISETRYDGEFPPGFWIEPGDLIVGMDGDFNCRIWNSERGLLNQRVCKISPNEDFFEKKLIYYLLPGYLKLINEHTHSITVKHLSSKTVSDIPLPLPSRAEQRRIVAKLDSLFARKTGARDELDRIPLLIEHYKQAILEKAFSGELTADWRLDHRSSLSASEFRRYRLSWAKERSQEPGARRDGNSAIIERDADLQRVLTLHAAEAPLPDTWEWCGLGEVFGVYVGATPSRKESSFWNGDIPWVSSGEVAFCRIDDTEEKISKAGLENTSTRLHPVGSVLLGMIGEGKTRGQAAVLDIEACNNQNCAAIRVSEASYSPDYVYWYLYAVYERTRTAGGGNNQPALNKDRVQRLAIPIAPPDEALAVVQAIEAHLEPIRRIEEELSMVERQLDHLAERLVAKAFRGDLVPQNPNDEPAHKLLERIRQKRADHPKAARRRRVV